MDKNLVAAARLCADVRAAAAARAHRHCDGHLRACCGFGLLSGFAPALNLLANVPLSVLTDYNLSVIPMFILMGAFCSIGHEPELFDAGLAWVGHRRGGLALAAMAACGGFAAINGSSVATAATMSQVALPEMRRAGYDPGLSAGLIAAGGTLGIMIPPSVIFVLYGIMTETDITKLFFAGVMPGLLAVMLLFRAGAFIAHRHPTCVPRRRAPRLGRALRRRCEPVGHAALFCWCWAACTWAGCSR
jgi:C4-dicarboxylate transporter DctM subunit